MKSGLYEDEKIFSCDNYTLDLYRACPRKFWWRIGRDLSRKPAGHYNTIDPKKMPMAPELAFGIAIHKAMDVLHTGGTVADAQAAFLDTFGDTEDPKNKRTPGRGTRLIKNYWKQWENEDKQWKTLQCEAPFELDLGDIRGYKVLYHGALDKIRQRIDDPSRLDILDHKTTSWMHGNMMQTWEISNQFYGYYAGARGLLGNTVDLTFTTDVIGMNPKTDVFQRQSISPTPEQMEEWTEGILATCRAIIEMWHVSGDNFEFWPKHSPSRCMDYMRPCEYLDICTSHPAHVNMTLDAMYYDDPWDPDER